MEYTTNYQLPQWVETDRIIMEDFNDMTSKIDAVLGQAPGKGNCQILTGYYQGNSQGITLSGLPGKPVFVAAANGNLRTIMLSLRDAALSLAISTDGVSTMATTWEDDSLQLHGLTGGRMYAVCVLMDMSAQ